MPLTAKGEEILHSLLKEITIVADADDVSTMDELGIARAMAAGQMSSPQKYENLWLFAIRITGTGMAYRSGIDEHVWRDRSLYLNDDFLARCNGLSVIWVHPDKAVLNHQEFADRIIGSVFLPYIAGEDVWAVVKIYDANAAEAMSTEQLSTSPTVVFRDPSVNSTIEENGKKILVEGKPSLLDHIAIVPLGVWDKSGPPKGVLNHGLIERQDSMSETLEEKKSREEREDAARRDAMADSMNKFMDAMTKRMDAMEAADKARKDSDEKEKEEKKDAASKDAKKRRDSEREGWAKDDAEGCAKDDAEETAECDAFKKDGMDEEEAADKARSARKDRMKSRKDAMEVEADKKRKDAEEEKKADARADAQSKEIAELRAQNARLEASVGNMLKSPNDDDYGNMAEVQFAADSAYQAFGKKAPAPMSGENVLAYRRRLANGLQRHSADWKDVDLRTVTQEVLSLAEKKIYSDAVVASRSSADIAEGIMIPIKKTTESGHQVIEYRGRTTIFKSMSSNPLYATRFHTERGA